jgi:ketosteroid isomerase-like protein
MSTEANKELAVELFARFTAGDLAGALDLLADDLTWWIAGKPGQSPAAGAHDKTYMGRLFHRMFRELEDGLRMTVESAVAEGDQVALQVESLGKLKNGRVYDQEYHLAMTVRDGRIREVREYLDTHHVAAVWSRPNPAEAAADRERILAAIESLNRAWLEGRYGDISGLVHDGAVMAPPGAPPVRGRDAFVRSYADFGAAATIHSFDAGEPRVECCASTAVAECPFVIDYEIPSGRFRERGVDLLVFTRVEGSWQICWRTMTATPADAAS